MVINYQTGREIPSNKTVVSFRKQRIRLGASAALRLRQPTGWNQGCTATATAVNEGIFIFTYLLHFEVLRQDILDQKMILQAGYLATITHTYIYIWVDCFLNALECVYSCFAS